MVTRSKNEFDLVKLKYKNINDGEIFFERKKTERTNKTIKEIDNLIFPYLEGVDDPIKRKYLTKGLTRRIDKRMKGLVRLKGLRILQHILPVFVCTVAFLIGKCYS